VRAVYFNSCARQQEEFFLWISSLKVLVIHLLLDDQARCQVSLHLAIFLELLFLVTSILNGYIHAWFRSFRIWGIAEYLAIFISVYNLIFILKEPSFCETGSCCLCQLRSILDIISLISFTHCFNDKIICVLCGGLLLTDTLSCVTYQVSLDFDAHGLHEHLSLHLGILLLLPVSLYFFRSTLSLKCLWWAYFGF